LNPAGRLVLLKAVLSALLVYQFSSLLAHASIKSSLEQSIRKFLWEGGKTSRKHYHLVKWQVVREPKEFGGLGIRDPTLVNLALGANLLWRSITGKLTWWKLDLLLQKSLLQQTNP